MALDANIGREIIIIYLLRQSVYPVTPFKGAAPLSGSIKDFTTFWKTKSLKKGACALFS